MSSNSLARRNNGFLAQLINGGRSTDLEHVRAQRDFEAEVIGAYGYLLTTAETSMTLAVNHGTFCSDTVPEVAKYVHGFQKITAVGIARSLDDFGRKISE